MTTMVFACYRPRPGREEELRKLVRAHAPTLRGLGMITSRDAYVMEAADGTIVEVFEWASGEAKREAHGHPRVREMWARFEELSESVPIGSLEEASRIHPHLKPL